ncbi:UNVERIFIED_CONTAM: hypothetical protein Slati_4517400 [Sesamum latifolium]|uniref:Uncharacterized protein n=1 Tax=Sesamum latifolium TaxID=2727402 RepID=A0AAW2STN7_9LAMI
MEIMGVVKRPMMEYLFSAADGTISSIVEPSVEANNFKIKPSVIQIIRSSLIVLVMMLLDLEFFHSHYVILLKTSFSLCLLLDRESLYDAWERFKSMLRKCPHHELPVWRQVQIFYNGVTLANRATIDAAAGGTIMKKLPSEAFNIIDEIATNLYSYGQERADKRTADIHNIDAVLALSAQMTAQTHKVDNLGAAMWNGASIGPCGACVRWGIGAMIVRSNFNPYSNTYNLGWPVTQIFLGVIISSRDPLSLINHDNHLHKSRKAISKICFSNSSPQQTPNFKIKMPDSKVKKHHLEYRGANWQLVSIVSGRKDGQLPSDTEKNSREQVNAIFVRNGRAIGDEPPKEQVEEAQAQEEESQEETKGSPLKLNLDVVPPYIPYSKRILKANLDKQFGNFLEIF